MLGIAINAELDEEWGKTNVSKKKFQGSIRRNGEHFELKLIIME